MAGLCQGSAGLVRGLLFHNRSASGHSTALSFARGLRKSQTDNPGSMPLGVPFTVLRWLVIWAEISAAGPGRQWFSAWFFARVLPDCGARPSRRYGTRAHHRLVLRAVAEEGVVEKSCVAHRLLFRQGFQDAKDKIPV